MDRLDVQVRPLAEVSLVERHLGLDGDGRDQVFTSN